MNDLLTTSNAVHCAFVTAKRVGATIEQIDPSAALQCKGVVAFYSAEDIPGSNNFVLVNQLTPEVDEVFVAGRVKYFDQPLGVIAALTHDAAVYAATLVVVTYARDQRKIFTTMNQVLAEKQTDRIVSTKKDTVEPLKLPPLAPGDVLGRGSWSLRPNTTSLWNHKQPSWCRLITFCRYTAPPNGWTPPKERLPTC